MENPFGILLSSDLSTDPNLIKIAQLLDSIGCDELDSMVDTGTYVSQDTAVIIALIERVQGSGVYDTITGEIVDSLEGDSSLYRYYMDWSAWQDSCLKFLEWEARWWAKKAWEEAIEKFEDDFLRSLLGSLRRRSPERELQDDLPGMPISLYLILL